nr:class I tRNA ligase family protein [Odoribacter sp.]
GINNPGNPEINYYYPTNDLVTGPDIIFFWVARMIMAGYEYEGKMPFRNVYFTGIVRDKLGRKMSKSLGNSPDPLDLIDKYGADGVRVGMLLCAPAGGDLLFDESLPEQGRNFTTKMWNAFKLVKSWEVADVQQPEHSRLAIEWFNHLLNKVTETLNTQFDQYRISEALMTVYTTFRDEFSSWLLEMIKPAYGQPIDRRTYDATIRIFEQLVQLLHPFMPFITEEIWQNLRERQEGESIMVSVVPTPAAYDADLLARFEAVKEVIVGIRNVRKQNNVAFKDALELKVKANNRYPAAFASVLCKMGNISDIETVQEAVKSSWSFIADTVEYFIPAAGQVNTEELKAKLEEELTYTRGFLNSVMKKLGNEKFVNGAPAQVVANERKKQADAEAKIAAIEAQLAGLK